MGAAFSKTLVAGEKVSLCCAATCLICCLVGTILAVLSIGIGLGYNHCFVDMKTRYKYVPAHYIYQGSNRERLLRTTDDEEAVNQLLDRDDTRNVITPKVDSAIEENLLNNSTDTIYGWGYHKSNNDSSNSTTNSNTNASYITKIGIKEIEKDYVKSEDSINIKDTETIPMSGLSLIDLIAKLNNSNKNYSIQIVRH